MPWFYVAETKNGGIFNHQIVNHLVEIKDETELVEIRKEPARFKELTGAEVAFHRRANFVASAPVVPPTKPVVKPVVAQPAPIQPIKPADKVNVPVDVKPVVNIKKVKTVKQ